MGIQALEAILSLKHKEKGERSYKSLRKGTRVMVRHKVWQACFLNPLEIGNVLSKSARPPCEHHRNLSLPGLDAGGPRATAD